MAVQVCYPFTTVILRMSSEKESVSEALRVIVGKDGIPGTHPFAQDPAACRLSIVG
eukprot:COSAG04_NODE_24116_length_327_cov_0.666667_2_plen_55_part_01